MQGLLPLYRYFEFSGRSSRAEFWQFLAIFAAAIVGALLLDSAIGNGATPLVTIAVAGLCIIPLYSVSARRLHDRGNSAKLLLAQAAAAGINWLLWYAAGANAYSSSGDLLVTLARASDWIVRGFAVGLLILYALRGDQEANEYGPPPTGANNRDEHSAKQSGPERVSSLSKVSTPQASVDPLVQIERLAKLRDSGALTEEEFAAQKAAFLSQL